MFSSSMACPDCGLDVPRLEPRSFSFNSTFGACPECHGLGSLYDLDPAKVRNVYAPQSGPRRRDRLIRLELGVGHQFLRTLRGYIGATSENRRSNLEQTILGEEVAPFHIRVNRLLFRLEAGWM